jgi:ATP-dependent exoDNAse (exonuclease V) beta subunit
LTSTISREATWAALERVEAYAGFAGHDSTVAAFERTLREIRSGREGVLPDPDLESLYREYRSILSGFYDPEDLMESAIRAAESGALVENIGTVVLYLAEPTDWRSTELLRTLLARSGGLAILGRINPESDEEVWQWAERLGLEGVAETGASKQPEPLARCAVLMDPQEEVRYAIRETIRLAESGVPFARIAILSSTPHPYQAALEDGLVSAGIPVHGKGLRKLRETLAGRALDNFLRLRKGDLRRSEVMDWLLGAPIQDRFGKIPGHEWNRITREAGVTRRLSGWKERLSRFARLQRSISEEQGSDQGKRLAQETERIIEFADWLALRSKLEYEDWAEIATDLQELLKTNLDIGGHGEEKDHLRLVREGLEGLRLLDRLALPPSPERVALAVFDILENLVPHSSRYGSGVFRGGLRDAVGLDFDHVLILGMCEGALPPPTDSGQVFPDVERGEGMPQRSVGPAAHRRVYDSVRSIAPSLTFCTPRVDRDNGRPHLPSVWYLDEATKSAANGEQLYSADLERLRGEPWLYYPHSFMSILREGGQTIATQQEYNLRSLFGSQESPLFREPGFAAGVFLQRERLSDSFSPFEGYIGENQWLNSATVSASSLETYAACPHQFFYKSVLRVRETDEPEDVESIDPMERGNVVHVILKRFIDRDNGSVETMDQIAAEELDRLERENLVSPCLLWSRERIKIADCARKFVAANEALCRELNAKPSSAEWRFGFDSQFVLPVGANQLKLKGSVDRIDNVSDGTVAVIDYKTGSLEKFRALKKDPFLGGEIVQLPLYGLVVARVRRLEPSFKAVYLVWDKEKLEWTPLSLSLAGANLAEFEENLSLFIESIHEGAFPARPGDAGHQGYKNCAYCPYDRCCPTDRSLAWKRIENAPLLRKLKLVANRYKEHTSYPPPKIEEFSSLMSSTIDTTVPDDTDVRLSIQRDLDQTLFIEAGAGTGKTTSLVSRIVELVMSGVGFSHIAAITYTRKAAGELQERLRMQLEKRARAQPTEAITQALLELDSAAIGTIDGFARTILSSNPLAAGLPPGFEVTDEIQSQLRFNDWWTELLEDLLKDPTLELSWNAALDVGVTPGRFRLFAEKLHQRWDRAPDQLREMETELMGFVVTGASRICIEGNALLRRFEGEILDEKDKLYQNVFACLAAWLAVLEELASSGQTPLLIEHLARKFPLNAGSAKNWSVPFEEVKAALSEFRDQVEKFRKSILGLGNLLPMSPILNRMCEAVQDFARERQRTGELEFHDLLVLTARLLKEKPAIREKLRRQYRRILVDEFQDTDPLQIEIFAILASEGPPVEPWHVTKIEPGRIFFVGDPKQSLYRFRGAEVEIYEKVKTHFCGEAKLLTKNFRSHSTVIEFVNDTFSRLLAREGQAQPVDLGSGRDGIGDYAGVHVLGGDRDGTMPAIRSEEAQGLANVLRQAVPTSGTGWKVHDKLSGESRSAKLRDIAVLLPTRTGLLEIEQALERAKIPYRIDSRSLLYGTQQVRDLLNLLRAIDDPTDQVAIVACLRSPAFGCSDRELFEHRQNGWDYLCAKPPDREPNLVESAMAELRRYHEIRGGLPVAWLLAKIVRERRLMELAIAHRRPRDQWRRIDLLLNDAQSFDAAQAGTLGQFLTMIDLLAENDASVNEAVVEEEDDDAVRILTIHAAKGLEYPIVVMAGLGSEPRNSESVRLAWSDDGGFDFALGSDPLVATLRAADSKEQERLQIELEDDRKLYVGATRARDHLVISLFHKSKKKSMAARLTSAIDFGRVRRIAVEEAQSASEETLPFEPLEIPTLETWKENLTQTIRSASPASTFAPTRIAKELFKDLADSEDDPQDAARDEHRPRGGADLGRAVHAVLQILDLADPYANLGQIVNTQAAAESQDPEEILALVNRALVSEPVVEAGKSPHWREMFLSAYCEGVLLEGYIDLIYRREDGEYVVVDYKTDGAYTGGAIDERMEKYKWQAGAYAIMMEQTLGQAPAECQFVFLRKGEPNVRSVLDLPESMAVVRVHLRITR